MSNVFPQIVSALEQFPQQQFSLLGIKLKFVTTIQIYVHSKDSRKNSFPGKTVSQKIQVKSMYIIWNFLDPIQNQVSTRSLLLEAYISRPCCNRIKVDWLIKSLYTFDDVFFTGRTNANFFHIIAVDERHENPFGTHSGLIR